MEYWQLAEGEVTVINCPFDFVVAHVPMMTPEVSRPSAFPAC
ncbi:hypothetical protein [Tumebacillus lipolyticus]